MVLATSKSGGVKACKQLDKLMTGKDNAPIVEEWEAAEETCLHYFGRRWVKEP